MTNASRSASRQVQTPGVTTTTDDTAAAAAPTALTLGAQTQNQDTSTGATGNSEEASQDSEASQLQSGAMGHPSAASIDNAGAGETKGPETVTITKEALDALIAQAAAGKAASQPLRVRQAELPDQGSIDSSKIKQAQLTKQGWVVPDSLGANPNGQKL